MFLWVNFFEVTFLKSTMSCHPFLKKGLFLRKSDEGVPQKRCKNVMEKFLW